DFPGNIRELRNIVQRANIYFCGKVVFENDIELLINKSSECTYAVDYISENYKSNDSNVIDLQSVVSNYEMENILSALEKCNWVIADAARILSLKRTTLFEKIKKHGLSK
ncbi:MAG: hypothetical protein KGQ42_08410, partial [Alphaproteobacteria bacterium]|nr:hypothetical protein [Alphaproteobacteria bacterium]